jgi:hypothetical protein
MPSRNTGVTTTPPRRTPEASRWITLCLSEPTPQSEIRRGLMRHPSAAVRAKKRNPEQPPEAHVILVALR